METASGLGVGLNCHLGTRSAGGRFALGAMGVSKWRANMAFADARCPAPSCILRHQLHDAPVAMLRHRVAPDAASAAILTAAPPGLGRDL